MAVCCGQPANDLYTVCFPDQQVLPGGELADNPFYDFEQQISYWTYTIQIAANGPTVTDLSHWNLQMCEQLLDEARENESNFFSAQVSENGGAFIDITGTLEALPNGDPSLDAPFNAIPVLKFEREQPKGTTFTYRLAIISPTYFNLAAQLGTILVKHGVEPPPGFQVFSPTTCAPNALVVPSPDCARVQVNGGARRGIAGPCSDQDTMSLV